MAPARDIIAAEQMEVGAILTSSSDDDQLANALRPQRGLLSGKRRLVAAAVATTAVMGVAAAFSTRATPREDVDASVQLFGAAALAAAASSMASGAKLLNDVNGLQPELEKQSDSVLSPLTKLKEQLKVKPGVSKLEVNVTNMTNLSKKELLHPVAEDRNDGNVCPDDEELHANLCYKKCSLLTQSKYPIRTTAWSCCMEEPCSFFNSKFTSPLKICSGFDKAGSAEGKGCPHAPGSCMENEEFNLGACYKKCAVLTNNTFPYRSAASTCCRYNNHFACMDALNTMTKPEFNVGGGLDDGHASTPNMTHLPMQSLTERNVPTVVPSVAPSIVPSAVTA